MGGGPLTEKFGNHCTNAYNTRTRTHIHITVWGVFRGVSEYSDKRVRYPFTAATKVRTAEKSKQLEKFNSVQIDLFLNHFIYFILFDTLLNMTCITSSYQYNIRILFRFKNTNNNNDDDLYMV